MRFELPHSKLFLSITAFGLHVQNHLCQLNVEFGPIRDSNYIVAYGWYPFLIPGIKSKMKIDHSGETNICGLSPTGIIRHPVFTVSEQSCERKRPEQDLRELYPFNLSHQASSTGVVGHFFIFSWIIITFYFFKYAHIHIVDMLGYILWLLF